MTVEGAQKPRATGLRQQALGIAGRAFLAARLQRWTLRGKGIVVAFHRVNDLNAGDGLTVGVSEFDAYCGLFKKAFKVVSLGEMISKIERGDPLNGELAITFDDGYLDNFEQAAPILRRHQLPACFFVTTTFIESREVPWWDESLPAPPEWMSWKQVQALHAEGFEIGAHTRTHADLGEVTGEVADREIAGAREELEDRLGGTADLFAYPYGGTQHLSEENRERARRAGFRCVVSCHGGLVQPAADPFRLSRVPVSSWYASAPRFGLDLALDRA